MAIVKAPLGSSEARGSVGGYTFNTWRGKATVKTRAGPSRTPTGPQQYWIDNLEYASAQWQTLPQALRDQWNQFAAQKREPHWTGQDTRLTGHNWFVRSAMLQIIALGEWDSYNLPTIPTFDFSVALLDIGDTYFDLVWPFTPFADEAHYYVDFWWWPAHSNGRKADFKLKSQLRCVICLPYTIELPLLGTGTYDIWWRTIHDSGAAGVFQTLRFQVT